MQSANEIVKDLLLPAHLFVFAREAILPVDELPYRRAVVVGEGLYVGVDVEVLALIVRLVLDVPDPPLIILPLVAPEIAIFGVRADEVGFGPLFGDVGLAAPADRAAVGFA